jgi:hypothetical protein
MRGVLNGSKGDREHAISGLGTAISLNPNDVTALIARGTVFAG